MISLDSLLGNAETVQFSGTDYVSDHAAALAKAHRMARARIHRELDYASELRLRKGAKTDLIPVGSHVLLTIEHYEGRHKLCDKYYDTSYVIIGVNEEQDVYEIRPAIGGPVQRVNRRRLILDTRDRYDDDEFFIGFDLFDENSPICIA